MKKTFLTLISVFVVLLFSCNSKKNDINTALVVYENWRQNQISTEKYYDKCPEKDDVTPEFLRYSLPKLENLTDTGFKSIDTMLVKINEDEKYDVFMKIRPKDCADGAGTFSQHEPMYLIIVSEPQSYKMDNAIIDKLQKEITSFTKKNTKSWAERFYMDTIYRKDSNLFVKGQFCVWVDNDAACCPSINMDYKALLPRKDAVGHIDLSGSVGQSAENSKEFNYRIEIQ